MRAGEKEGKVTLHPLRVCVPWLIVSSAPATQPRESKTEVPLGPAMLHAVTRTTVE